MGNIKCAKDLIFYKTAFYFWQQILNFSSGFLNFCRTDQDSTFGAFDNCTKYQNNSSGTLDNCL